MFVNSWLSASTVCVVVVSIIIIILATTKNANAEAYPYPCDSRALLDVSDHSSSIARQKALRNKNWFTNEYWRCENADIERIAQYQISVGEQDEKLNWVIFDSNYTTHAHSHSHLSAEQRMNRQQIHANGLCKESFGNGAKAESSTLGHGHLPQKISGSSLDIDYRLHAKCQTAFSHVFADICVSESICGIPAEDECRNSVLYKRKPLDLPHACDVVFQSVQNRDAFLDWRRTTNPRKYALNHLCIFDSFYVCVPDTDVRAIAWRPLPLLVRFHNLPLYDITSVFGWNDFALEFEYGYYPIKRRMMDRKSNDNIHDGGNYALESLLGQRLKKKKDADSVDLEPPPKQNNARRILSSSTYEPKCGIGISVNGELYDFTVHGNRTMFSMFVIDLYAKHHISGIFYDITNVNGVVHKTIKEQIATELTIMDRAFTLFFRWFDNTQDARHGIYTHYSSLNVTADANKPKPKTFQVAIGTGETITELLHFTHAMSDDYFGQDIESADITFFCMEALGILHGTPLTDAEAQQIKLLFTYSPTTSPSDVPSADPTATPTNDPTPPTSPPTAHPSLYPSTHPSRSPSDNPTTAPSAPPSTHPTRMPSSDPSTSPSSDPTAAPTDAPSKTPTTNPSADPSASPSTDPTLSPSAHPSQHPSQSPTTSPSETPTKTPTADPTAGPTASPTVTPSKTPSAQPTAGPTASPTATPTKVPTKDPTAGPSASPSAHPSQSPSAHPTASPTASPSADPTRSPTDTPSATPTKAPTASPSAAPTTSPSETPTADPTASPSANPTSAPTAHPSSAPSEQPTAHPSASPSDTPSAAPTDSPSVSPTGDPTAAPSAHPTKTPTAHPSVSPSAHPSTAPTVDPTQQPSTTPTTKTPTSDPTPAPSDDPSVSPTNFPSVNPTQAPTIALPMHFALAVPGGHDGPISVRAIINDTSGAPPPPPPLNASNPDTHCTVLVNATFNPGFEIRIQLGDNNGVAAKANIIEKDGDLFPASIEWRGLYSGESFDLNFFYYRDAFMGKEMVEITVQTAYMYNNDNILLTSINLGAFGIVHNTSAVLFNIYTECLANTSASALTPWALDVFNTDNSSNDTVEQLFASWIQTSKEIYPGYHIPMKVLKLDLNDSELVANNYTLVFTVIPTTSNAFAPAASIYFIESNATDLESVDFNSIPLVGIEISKNDTSMFEFFFENISIHPHTHPYQIPITHIIQFWFHIQLLPYTKVDLILFDTVNDQTNVINVYDDVNRTLTCLQIARADIVSGKGFDFNFIAETDKGLILLNN